MSIELVDKTPKKHLPEALEKNKWKEGQSGNPNGRPKGTLSIVGMLKKKLEDVPEGAKKTYAELLIDRILQMAIQDKNDQQIKNILQYIEGMPKGFSGDTNVLVIPILGGISARQISTDYSNKEDIATIQKD